MQTFIDLIERHEQSFYSFVHKVHSKGEGLFDSLMRWIEQFLTLMREGLGALISLEFLLPHTGPERAEILQEVDAVARYHYLLKVAYEDKVRRRFGRSQGQQSEADAQDEAAAEMLNGVVSDLSFGDLVSGDVTDLAAEEEGEEEESSSDEDEDEDESSSDGSGSSDSDDSGDSDSDSGSGSEESEDGSSTEGGTTRGTTPTPKVTRSQTIASPQRSYSSGAPKYSLDLPPGARPAPPPRARSSRSMSLSQVSSSSSSSKDLPPIPQSARPAESRNQPPASTKLAAPPKAKKKKPEGPKPPELHHLPKLLPLFVEMVRV